MQYSLCNEPWLKYTMGIIADRGLRPSQWTSSRLLKEILFLETHSERYEISRTAGTTGGAPDTYRFSKCRRILPLAGERSPCAPAMPLSHPPVRGRPPCFPSLVGFAIGRA